MSLHPLDRDDEVAEPDFDHSSTGNRALPHRTLLRYSVRAVIVIGILVVVTSVMLSNTNYGSSEWRLAFFANRLTMFLLLAAFIGILASYQKTNLERLQSYLNQGSGPTRIEPTTAVRGTSSMKTSSNAESFLVLIGACAPLVMLEWLCVGLSLMDDSLVALAISILLWIPMPGFLITLIVWHRGCYRAFAIGALPPLMMMTPIPLLTFFGSILSTGPSGSVYEFRAMVISIAVGMTAATIAGLICAAYVSFLEMLRRSSQEETVIEDLEQTNP